MFTQNAAWLFSSRVSRVVAGTAAQETAPQAQVADLGLQVLAVQSGGLVFTSGNDIAALLEECLANAVPYYEISFEPASSEKADEYHRLDVHLAKPGLTARTRQGYYALPSPRK
jgi:VWFA-related protein